MTYSENVELIRPVVNRATLLYILTLVIWWLK